MKKLKTQFIRFCTPILCLLLLLTLSACNDTTITTEPESVPSTSSSEPEPISSTSEAETLSDTAGIEGLPDEYCIKGGKLRLDLREFGVTMNVNHLPGQITDCVRFDLTEEQLKEKMLTLDFTVEELEKINHLVSSGYAYVADPRLITPLSLPNGCKLTSVAMGVTHSAYRTAGQHCFEINIGEEVDWCTGFGCTIMFAEGLTGDGEKGIYDHYPSIDTITDQTENFECYSIKNGRKYYIEYSFQTIRVRTFNSKHCYEYVIYRPTEECIKNILDYDPFTYLQVEY